MPVWCENGWYFGGPFEAQINCMELLRQFVKRMKEEHKNSTVVEELWKKSYFAFVEASDGKCLYQVVSES
jgi:hypothetical protein